MDSVVEVYKVIVEKIFRQLFQKMIVNFRNKLINFFLTSDYEAGSKVLNFLTWEFFPS